MHDLGSVLGGIQKRIDKLRNETKTSQESSDRTSQNCPKCNDTGVISTNETFENDSYTYKDKPMKYFAASVKTCECHYAKMNEKYCANVTFSKSVKEHTFMNAIKDAYNSDALEAAASFIRNVEAHQQEGTWIYIYADPTLSAGRNMSAYGTGKTYLMQCIANALAYRNIPAIYVAEEQLFGEIKSTYQRKSEESEMDVLRRYYTIPILMIDDLFSANYTEWSEAKLFSILDSRCNDNKITIITSNYATGRIEKKLPDNGGKIASRIIGKSVMIEMIGKDRRRKGA